MRAEAQLWIEDARYDLDTATLLNPHYTVARYVDAALGRPADLYDRSFAEAALQGAEEVLAWIGSRFPS